MLNPSTAFKKETLEKKERKALGKKDRVSTDAGPEDNGQDDGHDDPEQPADMEVVEDRVDGAMAAET